MYKFLSAFEEGVRAFIGNTFRDNIETFLKNLKEASKKILNKAKDYNSLSRFLESLLLSELITLILLLPNEYMIKLFRKTDHLKENLLALKDLRNAISHHRLLFVYEDFDECWIDGIKKEANLVNNINNLSELLDPYYKEYLIEKINTSYGDKEFQSFLVEKAKIKL